MTPMLANIGVPMIFVQMPAMVCALIPIIIVEALLIRRWLTLPYRDAFRGVTVANLASTILGVPLAWLAMFIVELAVMYPVSMAAEHWHWKLESPVVGVLGFIVSMAWLAPVERHIHWMIPAASALLLIPSFVVSVWFERRICVRSWSESDPGVVRSGVFKANLASYALLFVMACIWLGTEYFSKRGQSI